MFYTVSSGDDEEGCGDLEGSGEECEPGKNLSSDNFIIRETYEVMQSFKMM